jgi:hypothetical protein
MACSPPSHQYISFEVMIAQLYTEEWWKKWRNNSSGPSFLFTKIYILYAFL